MQNCFKVVEYDKVEKDNVLITTPNNPPKDRQKINKRKTEKNTASR